MCGILFSNLEAILCRRSLPVEGEENNRYQERIRVHNGRLTAYYADNFERLRPPVDHMERVIVDKHSNLMRSMAVQRETSYKQDVLNFGKRLLKCCKVLVSITLLYIRLATVSANMYGFKYPVTARRICADYAFKRDATMNKT